MHWPLSALCTVPALLAGVQQPWLDCSLGTGFSGLDFEAKHTRFAVICAQFACTYRNTTYGALPANGRGYLRSQLHTGPPALNCCSKQQSRHQIDKDHNRGALPASKTIKRGQKIRIPAPPRLTGAARASRFPESHRPPPGATPRGPGRSGFPATSQRGSEVYGPHIIRAGHGRVRRVARVTARGGAVRDEDH